MRALSQRGVRTRDVDDVDNVDNVNDVDDVDDVDEEWGRTLQYGKVK